MLIAHCGRENIRNRVQDDLDAKKSLLILTYLYAFHYEVYQLCYLYADTDFYNEVLVPFCDDPQQFASSKGQHPVLMQLIMPEANDSLPTSEEMIGRGEADRDDDLLARTYPHEHLRQVLWIRPLIVHHGAIPPKLLLDLQL
ncbi:MAG: hypothetical protein AAF399_06545 [Bacteroidota bacterium]